ncbi:sensor histidine kinase [Streptomyces uncialis]|nr:histidine kinase [Streptomyces uncialis]
MTSRSSTAAGPRPGTPLRGRSRGRFGRCGPWPSAVLLMGGAFVPAQGGPVLGAGPGMSTPWGLVLAGAVGAGSALSVLALPRLRSAPVTPLVVVGCAGWVVASVWTTLCAASYLVAATVREPARRIAYVAGAVVLVLLPTAAGLAFARAEVSWEDLLPALGGAALFVGLPFALGLWNLARRDVVEGLRERAAQLEREQAARAARARVRERTRIARDMHDVVAHRVSLMVLHAGALEVNAKDRATADGAELIRTTGREALAQLRDVLGVLRSSDGEEPAVGPPPTLVDLARLLDESRAAGIMVTRRDEGTPRQLPPLVGHAAYRVVREALTNVHKHAPGARTEVLVRYHGTGLEIAVRNGADSAAEPLPGSGMGLVALRERVELLDGEFTAGARADGGFVVRARMPLPPPRSETHG